MKTSTRTYEIGGVPLDDEAGRWWLTFEGTGSPAHPAPRLAETTVPGLDGALVRAAPRLEAGRLAMQLVVTDKGVEDLSGYPARRKNEQRLLLALGRGAARVLRLVEARDDDTLSIRETQAVLASSVDIKELTTDACQMSFELLLPKAYWWDVPWKILRVTPGKPGLSELRQLRGGSAPVWGQWGFKGRTLRVECPACGGATVLEVPADVPVDAVKVVDTESWAWWWREPGDGARLDDRAGGIWIPGLNTPGTPGALREAAPLCPDATGAYKANILVDGGSLPDGGEVRLRARKAYL